MAAIPAAALAWTSIATTVAATGYTAYNQYQAGKAQQALQNYNAAQAQIDANQRARDAQVQATAQRFRNRQLEARQRALYAKAGVVTSTGTPLMVMADQAATLEMNALQTEYQGETEAQALRQQGRVYTWQGQIARTAGATNSYATLLQGAGQTAGMAGAYKYQGVF